MSIALSALIKPSRRLSGVVVFMHVMAAAGLWLVGGSLSVPFPAWHVVIALLGTVGLSWSCVYWHRARMPFVLHVSGTGQMRLARSDASKTEAIDVRDKGESVRLLPASTIWPYLLVLHLQNAQGKTAVVLILRDAVSPEVFHGLLVACHWIAARKIETDAPGIRQI